MRFLLYAPLFKPVYGAECTTVGTPKIYVVGDTQGDASCTNNSVAIVKDVILKTTAAFGVFGSNQLWDPTDADTFKHANKGVAIKGSANDDTDALSIADYSLFYHGEIRTAATYDGANAARQYCNGQTRLIHSTTQSDESAMTVLAAGELCTGVGGTAASLDPVTTLEHKAEFAATAATVKWCVNIPYTTARKTECTAALPICDRFAEGASVCFATAAVMTEWTLATSTKNHCIRYGGATQTSPVSTNNTAKYRARAASEKSDVCAHATGVEEFCNPHGGQTNIASGDRCLVTTAMIAQTEAASVRVKGTGTGVGAGTKWCYAKAVGAVKCHDLQRCNPLTATLANVCIDDGLTTAAKFALAGSAGTATALDQKWCVANGAAEAKCVANEICNYAANGGTFGTTCLAHTALIGTWVAGAAWAAVTQHKKDGVMDTANPPAASLLCLAQSGSGEATVYLAEKCTNLEVCNTLAALQVDVCIPKLALIAHGAAFVAAVTVAPTAPAKEWCIGKTAYKKCAALDTCNEGASLANQATDVCVLTANVIAPATAHRTVGVALAADRKWCFGVDSAEKCTELQSCNPNGVLGATDEWLKICVTTLALVEHGATAVIKKADAVGGDATDKYVCIGKGASTAAAPDTSSPPVPDAGLLVCSYADGAFYKPAEIIGAVSQFADISTAPVTNIKYCFNSVAGSENHATCANLDFCNPLGDKTVTDGSPEVCGAASTADPKTACTKAHICIDPTEIITGEWSATDEAITVCISTDASKIDACTEAKPYCSEGECTESAVACECPACTEAVEGEGFTDADGEVCVVDVCDECASGGGSDSDDPDTPADAASRVSGFVAASVAAMLSA